MNTRDERKRTVYYTKKFGPGNSKGYNIGSLDSEIRNTYKNTASTNKYKRFPNYEDSSS